MKSDFKLLFRCFVINFRKTEGLKWIYTHVFIIVVCMAIIKVDGQCSGEGALILNATGSPQYFSSPRYPSIYPSNSTCAWRIYAPDSKSKIIINIEDYNTESEDYEYDYLEVYEGYNSSYTKIIRLNETNKETFNVYVSTGTVMYFYFVSDSSIQYKGFQILYFSNDSASQHQCGETLTVTPDERVLMSQYLPNNYNISQTCRWTFNAVSPILFRIKFLDMGGCDTDKLTFYDGSTKLAYHCSTALTYQFDDIETKGSTGTVEWKVSLRNETNYGFMLTYRNFTVTMQDGCNSSGIYMNASVTPNYDYVDSPGYVNGSYPSNTKCRWYISAPENYSVQVYFEEGPFGLERNSYCYYDYVAFYDGNTTNNLINKFCGLTRVTNVYRSSGTELLIVFSSDYALQYSGFRVRVTAVDNTYPACKADYTEYFVAYNYEDKYLDNNYTYINKTSTPNYNYGTYYYYGFRYNQYSTNLELYWLFTNFDTTNYQMVLDITSIYIEQSRGCKYDSLTLYGGPCTKDGIFDVVCGYRKKTWFLKGSSYLLHFHSDGYINRYGFELEYYAVKKDEDPEPTTTTTTNGPPVGAVIEAVKEMLGNYSTDLLPNRDLSEAVPAAINFYLVGINGIDEVEQKMTSTGQFQVTWKDSSLSWDPTKRNGVVKVLMPQDDLWKPDIALMNGFTKIEAMGASFMLILVDYNGSCIWNPFQIMESVCKVDMTYYPYDRQTCVLKFGTWSSDDSEVQTELGPLGLQIHPNFQENGEWLLIGTETKQEDKNNHKTVDFFLTVERNPSFVTFYMTIPVVTLAYMNVFTFVIPSGSGEKSGFCITIFLSFVVLLIINSSAIPDNSDSISLYAAYVLTMTLMSGVALIICVLQIRAISFTERRYPIPERVQKLIKFIQRIRSKLSCPNKKEKEESNEDDKKARKEKRKRKAKDKTKANENKHESNGYSTSSEKKRIVSFKLEEPEPKQDEVGNDRFIMPRKVRPTSRMSDREAGLFEPNALTRRTTDLWIESHARKDRTVSPEPKVSTSVDGTMLNDDVVVHNQESNLRENNESVELSNESMSSSDTGIVFAKQTKNGENNYENAENSQAPPQSIIGTAVTSSLQNVEINQTTVEISKFEKGINSHTSKTEHTPSNEITYAPSESQNTYNEQSPDEKKSTAPLEKMSPSPDEKISTSTVGKSSPFEKTTASPSDTISIPEPPSAASQQESPEPNTEWQKEDPPQYDDLVTDDRSFLLSDHVIENQPVSAEEFKMNRPPSEAETSLLLRPSSVSESRNVTFKSQTSLEGNRLSRNSSLTMGNRGVFIDNGRAVSGHRPSSKRDSRGLSVLSQRPMSFLSSRPVSVMSQKTSDGVLNDNDNTRAKSPVSDSSSDSSSDESDVSGDEGNDSVTWADLDSCVDYVFFTLYMFLTTLISLSIFLVMVTAY